MANSTTSEDFREQVIVDTAPAAAGYYTNEVNARQLFNNMVREIYLSIRGTGNMTVTLEFKMPGDSAWSQYAQYSANILKVIRDPRAGAQWRAGVKSGEYQSGSFTFGFNW